MQTIKVLADQIGEQFYYVQGCWNITPKVIQDAIEEIIHNRREIAKAVLAGESSSYGVETILRDWAKEPPTDTRIKLENLLEDYRVSEDIYKKLESMIDD